MNEVLQEMVRESWIVQNTLKDIYGRLKIISEYIPFVEKNFNFYSLKFHPIITSSCSLLENVINKQAHRRLLGADAKDEQKIYAHLDFIEKYYHRERIGVYLYNLSEVWIRSYPFKDPVKGPDGKWTEPPSWWTAHNGLKHNLLEEDGYSTLINAIEAFMGCYAMVYLLYTPRAMKAINENQNEPFPHGEDNLIDDVKMETTFGWLYKDDAWKELFQRRISEKTESPQQSK